MIFVHKNRGIWKIGLAFLSKDMSYLLIKDLNPSVVSVHHRELNLHVRNIRVYNHYPVSIRSISKSDIVYKVEISG